jgi:acyl-coenzyme A synthetase/AMP-(fatty) acid ligase
VIKAVDPRASAICTATRTIDHAALDALTEQLRTNLVGCIEPGAALGICVLDAVDFAASVAAATAAGAETFLLAPDAPAESIQRLCDYERAAGLLCDPATASRFDAPQPPTPCSPDLVLVELPARSRIRAHDEGTVHFFSSGTEGQPTGVVRTQSSLDREAIIVGSHLELAPGSVVLCAAPLVHGYAFTGGLFAPLACGATSVVVAPRLPGSLAKALRTYEPEVVLAVPAQYAAWSGLREPYDGPMPRLWLSSGAPLTAAVRERFQSAWGGVICEQYGMTECGAISVDLEASGTLGRPYPGIRIWIEPEEPGATAGKVVVSTPHGPCCYVGADHASGHPPPFAPDGYRSADTGWLDEDGRLHLVGRRSNHVNVRGRKVDPAEVERALWQVRGVADVAVIGIDRSAGDQWIAAFVVADGVTEEALHAATASLESYKRPQRIIRLPALPKSPNGKTDLAALQAVPAAARA